MLQEHIGKTIRREPKTSSKERLIKLGIFWLEETKIAANTLYFISNQWFSCVFMLSSFSLLRKDARKNGKEENEIIR